MTRGSPAASPAEGCVYDAAPTPTSTATPAELDTCTGAASSHPTSAHPSARRPPPHAFDADNGGDPDAPHEPYSPEAPAWPGRMGQAARASTETSDAGEGWESTQTGDWDARDEMSGPGTDFCDSARPQYIPVNVPALRDLSWSSPNSPLNPLRRAAAPPPSPIDHRSEDGGSPRFGSPTARADGDSPAARNVPLVALRTSPAPPAGSDSQRTEECYPVLSTHASPGSKAADAAAAPKRRNSLPPGSIVWDPEDQIPQLSKRKCVKRVLYRMYRKRPYSAGIGCIWGDRLRLVAVAEDDSDAEAIPKIPEEAQVGHRDLVPQLASNANHGGLRQVKGLRLKRVYWLEEKDGETLWSKGRKVKKTRTLHKTLSEVRLGQGHAKQRSVQVGHLQGLQEPHTMLALEFKCSEGDARRAAKRERKAEEKERRETEAIEAQMRAVRSRRGSSAGRSVGSEERDLAGSFNSQDGGKQRRRGSLKGKKKKGDAGAGPDGAGADEAAAAQESANADRRPTDEEDGGCCVMQ